jgi:transposase
MADTQSDLVARIESLAKAGNFADIAALVKDVLALEKKNADLLNRCETAEESVRTKDWYIRELTRLLYGRRSEKLTPRDLLQLCLALGGDEAAFAIAPNVPLPAEPDATDVLSAGADAVDGEKKKTSKHKGRGKLSANLERIITNVDVPAQERACKCCGNQMKCIGRVEHETVEHIPEKFVVHVESREKLACKTCDGDIATAARSDNQGDVRVGSSVLATLLDGKGEDALPVHRLADRFKRLGWAVPYNTLLTYWSFAADLLEPIGDATFGKVLDDHVVALDDTGLDVIGNRKGDKKFRGHLWCATNTGPLTGFRFTESWRHEHIAPWVDAITGFIQVDDYKGYGAIVYHRGSPEPLVPRRLRLGCMMHVRRKFYEAFVLKDKRAAEPIDLIKRIYKFEETAKEKGMSPSERLEWRKEHSVPLVTALYKLIEGQASGIGVTSKYSRAVNYAIAQKEFIVRCFSDGRFEIDNGKTEREIRRPAVGRKNYLFTGSIDGGRRLATVYTLILSCRNLGIDAREYLIDVLDKLRNQWPLARLSELIPDNWAAARRVVP